MAWTGVAAAMALWTAAADSWPGFRGAGRSLAEAALPLKWSDAEGLAWHAALPGFGQSSPVVHGGQVFVTTAEGPNKERGTLLCLGLADGKVRWQRSVEAFQTAAATTFVSRSAPTPCVDADRVYAFWESGEVVAFGHDGKEMWRRRLTQEFGKFQNDFGVGSSLAQSADAIFVLIDDKGPSYLLALDKATGKTRWKKDRPSVAAWSSPVAAEILGKPAVVASSAGRVVAYDAATGDEVFAVADAPGNNMPSATVDGTSLLVGAGSDRNAGAGDGAKSNMLLELSRADGKVTAAVKWRAEKASCAFMSPLLHRGVAYFVNRAGVVTAVDAETGAEAFSKRLGEMNMATPLGAGDRVYFFGRDGATTVLKADKSGTVLATNTLTLKPDEKAQASKFDSAMGKRGGDGKGPPGKGPPPGKAGGKQGGGGPGNFEKPGVYGIAAADGRVLLRTGSHLYCVGN